MFKGLKKKELTQEEALKELSRIFHKTRLTDTINLDPHLVYYILYGEKENNNETSSR